MTKEKPPIKLDSIWERYPNLEKIRDKLPEHLLIIPDGNRRFARGFGLETIWGHEQGTKNLLAILRDLRELPIPFITLWAFSADNWNRPPEETSQLMKLLNKTIGTNLEELKQNNVRLVHLGRKDRIPEDLRQALISGEEQTRNNTGQALSLAIDFGGEDQSLRINQRIAQMTTEGRIKNPEVDITEKLLESLRDGGGLVPSADLLIRTQEHRTSDIGWLNGKSTELYFINDKNFPEIKTKNIIDGLIYFAGIERRLGA